MQVYGPMKKSTYIFIGYLSPCPDSGPPMGIIVGVIVAMVLVGVVVLVAVAIATCTRRRKK